jgi:hypothetical protein
VFEKQLKTDINRRGGRRPGAGRKLGGKNKRTLRNETIDSERRMPLQHMLDVMDDPKASQDRRDRMAIAAAPYLHPRLSSIDSTTRVEVDVTPLTAEERRQRARQAILEAFAERPLKLIEGEVVEGGYKVIAGTDVSAAVEKAKGEVPEGEKPPSTISSA